MKQFIKIKVVKIILFAFILFAAGITNAQIGIGVPTPNASAQLDVSSTSKGFLPPRMTQAQRNAIVNPVPGLLIWCKDCGVVGEVQVFNGGSWTNMVGGNPAAAIPNTTTIGIQEWMTRNLDVATYRNGDSIPEVTDPAEWANLTTGAWCYYNNDPALGAVYGKLYNRFAVTDPRGLAPVGWHIPNDSYGPIQSYDPIDPTRAEDYINVSDGEWLTLLNNLGGEEMASVKMKAAYLWNSPYNLATNSSGFTALPGGFRNKDGAFSSVGSNAKWWGTNGPPAYAPQFDFCQYHVYYQAYGLSKGFDRILVYGGSMAGEYDYIYNECKNWEFSPSGEDRAGFSVRCIKDNTVKIGEQTWMLKNLDVATFRNGDTIPQVTDSAAWATTSGPAWCYYNNDPANGPVYGRLYNRSAINDPRGLAPLGWHIPNRYEMQDLQNFLGDEFSAGNKMRDTGTAHWNGPNLGATNESGFTGLAGGHRTVNGAFESKGVSASWWNTSEEVVGSDRDAETIFLYNTLNLSGFYQNGVLYSKIFGYPDGIIVYYPTGIGLSVRCIKD